MTTQGKVTGFKSLTGEGARQALEMMRSDQPWHVVWPWLAQRGIAHGGGTYWIIRIGNLSAGGGNRKAAVKNWRREWLQPTIAGISHFSDAWLLEQARHKWEDA